MKGGTSKAGRSFIARTLANVDAGPRLGLIVGKKVAPRAVDRNRVKRLVRTIYRRHAAELDGLDLVVQLKGNPRKHDNASLVKELEMLMLGLIKPGRQVKTQ